MINGRTRLAALIGFPAEHSASPDMHCAAFQASQINAVCLALSTPESDLPLLVQVLQSTGALGASVTTPYKRAVIACCDSLSEAASALDAVNCLEFGPGGVVGHNTDGTGFASALVDQKIFLEGQNVVILGSGGAARAVYSACYPQAAVTKVVTRTPENVDWVQAVPWRRGDLSTMLSTCDVLVDCTSIGMSEESERRSVSPLPLDHLPAGASFASLIYHRESALAARASDRGLRVINGAAMLLHQGAHAFKIWTGREAPLPAMRDALTRYLAQ